MNNTINKTASRGVLQRVRKQVVDLLAPIHAAIDAALVAAQQPEKQVTPTSFPLTMNNFNIGSGVTAISDIGPLPRKISVTDRPGIIKLLNEDKNFYVKVLQGAGIPVTSSALSFLMAWRQVESGKYLLANFNPFNISVTDYGTVGSGSRSYDSESDGIEATASALRSGTFASVASALKKGDGSEIDAAQALVSSGWPSGSKVKQLLESNKELDPPAIYRPPSSAIIPLKPPKKVTISSGWGPRGDPMHHKDGQRMHYGIDIAVGRGSPIFSVYDGSVVGVSYTSHKPGYGGYNVSIASTSPDKHMMQYIHLDTTHVKPGASVTKGQIIGTSGSAGTGQHLHLQARTNGELRSPTPEECAASVGIRTGQN